MSRIPTPENVKNHPDTLAEIKKMPTSTIKYFTYEHLPPRLKSVSKAFAELAHQLESEIPESVEKSAGMRKLLEAKDCFVRAALEI